MIASLIPEVFLFIVAFLVLAMFWLGHNRQFHFVGRIDPVLLWINIQILIAIVFVPFSTDIAGDYPEVTAAALLFHANMFIVGIMFSVQWGYICRHTHLCQPEPDTVIVHRWSCRTMLVTAIAVIGGILCFRTPSLSLLVYLTLPVWTALMSRILVTVKKAGCLREHLLCIKKEIGWIS